MGTMDTLLAYSEWLDSEGLVVSDEAGDARTLEDLAGQFIQHWQSDPKRAALAKETT